MSADSVTLVHVDAERGFSGGEVQVFLLIEGLRARGHRCQLVAPEGSAALAEARARGIEHVALPLRGTFDAASVVRLCRHLKRLGPTLVHLHTARATWLGGLAAWGAGVPAIATRRMDRPVRRGARTRFIHHVLLRRVAAISPVVREQLVAGGVDPARIVLVPSVVDPQRARARRARADVRAELGAAPGELALLSLGALVPRKGYDVLIAALELLAHRNLRPKTWIAGDGPEQAELERLIAAAGLSATVRLLGRRADVGDLLGAADVFVLPSRAEGLGVAALEAMAAGRPVVASRVGGLAHAVVDGRTGLLVPPGDPAALAAAIEELARDGGLRLRLGSEGPLRVAEGFRPEHMVAAYERIYAEVLAQHTPRAATGALARPGARESR